MSIKQQIVCDGCGETVNLGMGKDRKKAHVARAELAEMGWFILSPYDRCPECAAKRRIKNQIPGLPRGGRKKRDVSSETNE